MTYKNRRSIIFSPETKEEALVKRDELIKAIVALLEKAGEKEIDLVYRFIKKLVRP